MTEYRLRLWSTPRKTPVVDTWDSYGGYIMTPATLTRKLDRLKNGSDGLVPFHSHLQLLQITPIIPSWEDIQALRRQDDPPPQTPQELARTIVRRFNQQPHRDLYTEDNLMPLFDSLEAMIP